MPATLPTLLKQVFGYDAFRPLQREIMQASLAGRDAVAILPTGAGKSLCYQLPALARGGLTVVVSPLIALMKDQVDQLQAAGVAATFINSSLDGMELRHRMRGLDAGDYKLLYAAPERLMMPDFLSRLPAWNVSALAVDEAHCISEWGHDFRPEYRQLAAVRQSLPDISILALTATATPRVRQDIVAQLRLRTPEIFVASFNRPNLTYRVIPKSKPVRQVWEFARARPEDSGIVYCQSRKSTEAMAAALREEGLPVVAYHAGLDAAERTKNQEAFLRDEARIVCATVAFGMGINKPNVRYVIHADLPKNVEGYYQETGRAGRDGLPSDCLLLYSRGDVMKYLRFLEEITDDQARKIAHQQLNQMADYAEDTLCRRISLLGYFGERWKEENCGACDNCLEPHEIQDATVDAQKFLSCVLRIQQKSRFSVGLQHIADVLCGGNTERVRRWGHDALTTYGIGKDRPRAAWVDLGRQLLRLGYVSASVDGFGTLILTNEGIRALRERTPIRLAKTRDAAAADSKAVSAAAAARAGDIPCDEDLFQELRKLRKQLADARDVPPYVIFSDVSLRHMARRYPDSPGAFLAIPGVGQRKFDDYGAPFLAAISGWLKSHPKQQFAELEPPPLVERKMRAEGMSSGAMASVQMFRTGVSPAEIARRRDLSIGTISKHLASAIVNGDLEVSPRQFYTEAEERLITNAAQTAGWERLGPLHEALDGKITYEKLHFFRAFRQRDEAGKSGG